jgi:hypothetical protein
MLHQTRRASPALDMTVENLTALVKTEITTWLGTVKERNIAVN